MKRYAHRIFKIALLGMFAFSTSYAGQLTHDDILKQIQPLSAADVLRFLKERNVEAGFLLGKDVPAGLQKEAFKTFSDKLQQLLTAKDSDELSSRLLVDFYGYFRQDGSIPSLLLADDVKRAFIEYASVQMLSASNRAVTARLRAESSDMELQPRTLLGLRSDGPKPNEIRNPAASLLNASQSVWFSHGFTNRVDGYYGLSELYGRLGSNRDMPSSEILKTGDRVALAVRLLNTEQLRAVAFQGLAEFLLRGGELRDISLSDVSSFYQVLPLDECMQFSFPPLAKKFLTPADVLVAAGRFRPNQSERVWMKSAFR